MMQNIGIYPPISEAQSNSHNRLTLQVYKYTKEIPLFTDSNAMEAEKQSESKISNWVFT